MSREASTAGGRWLIVFSATLLALTGAVGVWLLVRAPAQPSPRVAGAVDPGVTPDWARNPVSVLPPAAPATPTPLAPSAPVARVELSANPPSRPDSDDRSPVLAKILELAAPSAAQEKQIRAAWKEHEDGRRRVLAERSPSAAPPEVYFKSQLGLLDAEFEMTLQSKILDPEQRERVLQAIGHRYSPNKH